MTATTSYHHAKKKHFVREYHGVFKQTFSKVSVGHTEISPSMECETLDLKILSI